MQSLAVAEAEVIGVAVLEEEEVVEVVVITLTLRLGQLQDIKTSQNRSSLSVLIIIRMAVLRTIALTH